MKPKKCPVCNSTKIEIVGSTFYCRKCGYLNKEYPEVRKK